MLRRVVLLLFASTLVAVLTACGGGGANSSLVPPAAQSPGQSASGIVADPKPTDVPANDTLRGGITIGQDGLVYVSGQTGLDQFTQSLVHISTMSVSAPPDTWPHISANLVPAGPVTTTGSKVNALATLTPATPAPAVAVASSTPAESVLVQFDTTSHTWLPVTFIDNIAGDMFVDFVQGPGLFGQPVIIGDRLFGSGLAGFLALPNASCGTPPFLFDFPIVPGPTVPFGVGALDSNGVIWVASDPSRNSKAPSNAGNPSEIFAFDPNANQVTHLVTLRAGSQVNGMVLGPDNAMWFTDGGLNEIGRVAPNGALTEFPLHTGAGLQPQGITVGADGALWFTELHGNRIGRITTSGSISETNVPTANAQPKGIVGCGNGTPCTSPTPRAVFFAEHQKVGKVTF